MQVLVTQLPETRREDRRALLVPVTGLRWGPGPTRIVLDVVAVTRLLLGRRGMLWGPLRWVLLMMSGWLLRMGVLLSSSVIHDSFVRPQRRFSL